MPEPNPGPGGKAGGGFPPGTVRFPLTIAQASIALDSLALPDSPVSNTGDIARIHAAIDCPVFAEACRRVVAETPALRVALRYRDGLLLQEFPALEDYKPVQHDCSDADDPEQAAEARIEEIFWMPRPWNSFPLFQFALIKVGTDHFVFLQKFHHVLADAIGRFQCFQRIAATYEALVRGVEPPPSETRPLTARIADDTAYFESESYKKDQDYWIRRLDNLPETLVEGDRAKSERSRSGRPARLSHTVTAQDFARLQQSAAALGSSVPRLVLSLAYIAIARLNGVTDIVIGMPGHNRATQAAKRSIDLSMTVMPFRMNFASTTTIAGMQKDIAALQLADRRRSRFPFASLVRSGEQRDAGQAVFDVIVNYIPALEPVMLGGAKVNYTNHSAGFYPPWAIDMREAQGGAGAQLTVAYDPGLIEAGDGARLARTLHFLLTNPVDLSQQTVGTIPIMSEQDHHLLLVELNGTDACVPADATLASLCSSQAERTPNAIAAICGTQSITYAQLHAKAEAMAQRLRAAGIGPEAIVGVALPRDMELIVTLLAIHKAGGAYLPLDPTLPAERLAYMIEDSRARLVMTTRSLARDLPNTPVRSFFLDDPAVPAIGTPRNEAAGPASLAYVIYTSGSTGLPKAVAVEHRSAVNMLSCLAVRTAPEDLAGIVFSTSLNFDASVDEIFLPLVTGGRMIIVETLLSLPSAPARHQARYLAAPPSVFEALFQVGGFAWGDQLLRFGGEALSEALVDRVRAAAPQARIENAYGPTENTIYATIAVLPPEGRGKPPIGKGLWNIKLYVLDRNQELLPRGAKGELYIGGASLARGYLNRPELTAERFVQNPFGEGRLYRTGDIVRWREDGQLDYVDRADAQVKINGLRIELGEIEQQLESLPEIASAVALVRPDDEGIRRIFAFAIARTPGNRPDLSSLAAHLRAKLPKYMIPAALTWVDKFPLTSSGKLDRNALSLPQWRKPEKPHRPPSNGNEKMLARIWCEVLNNPKIGVDEDFFELGGTSLQAVMIFARIFKARQLDFPAATMLKAPTIALQALLLSEVLRESDKTRLVAFREKGEGPPVFFVHGGGGGVMHVRDLMQDIRNRNPLYGLRPPPLDGTERLPRTIEKLARNYISEIRKLQPAGPYHLVGFSAGGTIAFEMAQQWMAMGEKVQLLGLIETDTRRYGGAARKALRKIHDAHLAQKRAHLRFARRLAVRIRDSLTLMAQIAKRRIKQAPNEMRHALGIPIPHEDRHEFYIRKLVEAEEAYLPRRYPGVVTLFTRARVAKPFHARWVNMAQGGLVIYELSVKRHLDIVSLPTSRFLAAQIDASLNALTSAESGPQRAEPG